MKVFLLLLGAQMLHQLEAKGHENHKGGDVCNADFWDPDEKFGSTKTDLDDTVVIVETGIQAFVTKTIELGTLITEPGAWMTISDGAFVTIDTDNLDCGLEGCSVPPDVKKVNTHTQLGFDKQSGKVVACGGAKTTTAPNTKYPSTKPPSTKPPTTKYPTTKPPTYPSTKPPTTKAPSTNCPATCHKKTCDHWLEEVSYTCATLESDYGCDCGGCACKVDKEEKQCEEDLCYGRTCPVWEGKHGVKCDILMSVFKCTCNGCDCNQKLHECKSPEYRGDTFCDDENNNKECNWDGGDCCHNGNNQQFNYCKECKCRDPTGQASKLKCALKNYKGDGYCDDSNNKYSCDWDGGDCCGSPQKHVQTSYCSDCLCKDPNHKGSKCIHKHLGDGFCDDENNTPQCEYDHGDCCKVGHNNQFRYCKECKCLDPAAHKASEKCNAKCGSQKHKGDHYCDDDNNRCGCGWDGGDCCGKNGNRDQYETCHQCTCRDRDFKKPLCAIPKYKADNICDDDNNTSLCDWDGGDCCKSDKNKDKEQFRYCKQCRCLQ